MFQLIHLLQHFAAAAVLIPDSELLLKDVLINPTRDGFSESLKRWEEISGTQI